MRLSVVRGRDFSDADTDRAPRVVIVSEPLARRLWPGQDPVGKRLLTLGAGRDEQGRPRMQTVVGIVREARYRGLEHPRLDVYVPHLQSPVSVKDLVVRTAGDPASLLPTIQREIRASHPQVLAERADMMSRIVSTAVAPWRFNMVVFALFGALALVLTSSGLFGLMAHSVSQRTREIGVRMALGADARGVVWLVLRQALGLAAIAIVIGLVMASIVSRFLSGMLFGLAPNDAASFAIVALLLLGVALIASYLPARRAAAIDPAVALEAD